MKILITGGAGFIGSHLAEAYLKRGDEVYILDDFSTGAEENVAAVRRSCPDQQNRLFLTRGSVLDREVMLGLIGICDVVVHLAAAVGVQYILDNPLSSIVTNIQGTEIALELADKFKKKILIASTSEVYGKRDPSSKKPFVETDDCIYGPSVKSRWSYAASKLMDEFAALAFHRTKGLPVVIVRFFNTVGPRQTGRYGMVIPRFVGQALRSEPITIYGDGNQTRTFTHVHEVVDCMMKLIESPKAIGQVVNIGGVEEISILDLAKRIIEMTGSKSKLTFTSYEDAYPKDFEDMQWRVPSTEKLKSIIGFAPELHLHAILKDIIHASRS